MTDEAKKEELKIKIQEFFDKKLSVLMSKSENDLEILEKMKYDYYDNVIIEFRKIEGDKNKPSKEIIEPQSPKPKKTESKIASLHNTASKTKLEAKKRPKTPLMEVKRKSKIKQDTTNEIEGKIKSIKAEEKKNIIKKEKGKIDKPVTAITKGGGKKIESNTINTSSQKRLVGKSATKPKIAVKGKTGNKKDSKKVIKKNQNNKQSTSNLNEQKEEEGQKQEEEKKPLLIKESPIYSIPEEIKSFPSLISIYIMLQKDYLGKQQKKNIIITNSFLFKSFGCSLKFLFSDKIKELHSRIEEIETFFNRYGDIENYLSKEFNMSKTAQQSLTFFTKTEEQNFLKKDEVAKEVGLIFRFIYNIIDEPFDESLSDKELISNLIQNIFPKRECKDLKSLLINYVKNNKDLNINKEKFNKIEQIVNQERKILSSMQIIPINRTISYVTFFVKEAYEFTNLKTLDGVMFYELRLKNKELKKYKDQLNLIENEGKIIENSPTEENIKVNEKKVDNTNTQQDIKNESLKNETNIGQNENSKSNNETNNIIKENKTENINDIDKTLKTDNELNIKENMNEIKNEEKNNVEEIKNVEESNYEEKKVNEEKN